MTFYVASVPVGGNFLEIAVYVQDDVEVVRWTRYLSVGVKDIFQHFNAITGNRDGPPRVCSVLNTDLPQSGQFGIVWTVRFYRLLDPRCALVW